jgi:DNA modification methylase
VKPDFNKVRQPYKNPNDKRIKQRIAEGKTGAKLYDWWNINQVKNVSKEKTGHPCQMPLDVMKNIIGILPSDAVIVDPFMGSGTTGAACVALGRFFIGIEQDKEYFEIAKHRLDEALLEKNSLLGGVEC